MTTGYEHSITSRLSADDWDSSSNAWNCSLLTIKGAKLDAVDGDGRRVDPASYSVDEKHGLLRWGGAADERPAQLKLRMNFENGLAAASDEKFWRRLAIVVGPLATVIGVIISGVFDLAGKMKTGSHTQVMLPADSFAVQMQRAIKKRKLVSPYGISSLAQLVRLEHADNAGSPGLAADWRIVYGLLAHEQIRRSDGHFVEAVHSSVAIPFQVPGSEYEGEPTPGDPPNPGQWFWPVQFDLGPGQRRTIVTGSSRIYRLPLSPRESRHGGGTLSASADEFCYPNGSDDTIGATVLLVESSSVRFKNAGEGTRAYFRHADGRVDTSIPALVRFTPASGNTAARSVVSAHFPRILQNEIACLVVAW